MPFVVLYEDPKNTSKILTDTYFKEFTKYLRSLIAEAFPGRLTVEGIEVVEMNLLNSVNSFPLNAQIWFSRATDTEITRMNVTVLDAFDSFGLTPRGITVSAWTNPGGHNSIFADRELD